jgi:serine/threonine-protein kinase
LQTTHDLIGKTIAERFVITHVIGEGAMGIVYRGFDESTLAEVAIKVLQPSLAVYPELVARFHREASALRRVDHDGAVRVLGRGDEGGVPFIVMELLHGESLAHVIHRAGCVPEARAARIMVQICEALAIAHERGVVHRDIKPDNIMIVDGGPLGERVKILDFGVAKRVAASGGNLEDSFSMGESTRMGALVGTPEYMAPEQCMAGEVDHRADLYACGVLLYRMVTGHLPFEGEHQHPLELLQRHLGEEPPAPRAVAPWVSVEVEAIILKAMRKTPSDRHASATELRDDLAKLIAVHEEIEMEPTERVSRADLGLWSADVTAALDVAASAPPSAPAPVEEAPIARAPEIAPPPSTPAPSTARPARLAARRKELGYGPVVALAAVIGAGVGSLLVAFLPLLSR